LDCPNHEDQSDAPSLKSWNRPVPARPRAAPPALPQCALPRRPTP